MSTGLTAGLRALIRRFWRISLVRGAVAVLVSVIALVQPDVAALVAALALGVYALGDGLINVVEALLDPRLPDRLGRIVVGSAAAAIGVLVIIWPRSAVAVAVIVFGICTIVFGVFQLLTGLAIRAVPGSGWVWAGIAGLLAATFGFLVLTHPAAGLTTVVWIVALIGILWGLSWIVLAIRIRSTAGISTI